MPVEHRKPPSYIPRYRELFSPLLDRRVVLLELGVEGAGSLRMWSDWFPNGLIVGIDIREPAQLPEGARFFQGQQQDTAFLDRVAREVAPGGFDVVIDDAAHIGRYAQASFWHLFDHHLKAGGLYIIEDWGTGYWPSFPDGAAVRTILPPVQTLRDKVCAEVRSRLHVRPSPFIRSHCAGMVGFVKQLVDAVAAGDIQRENPKTVRGELGVAGVDFRPGMVIVRKVA